MSKTLTDYLGASASLTDTTLTIDLAELKSIIDPSDPGAATTYSDDQAIGILVAGLHHNAQQALDPEGVAIVDPDTALVAANSFNPKTFEVRGDEAQVRHEFPFYIYTIDSTAFDPDNVV